jgi:hypothetical protein
MEAATLDHKLQWHSEASNAKNQPRAALTVSETEHERHPSH